MTMTLFGVLCIVLTENKFFNFEFCFKSIKNFLKNIGFFKKLFDFNKFNLNDFENDVRVETLRVQNWDLNQKTLVSRKIKTKNKIFEVKFRERLLV